MNDSTLTATLERLYRLQTFGIKFGLETISTLLSHLGQPQQDLRYIHVAGSNGKGSVCAMLEAVLRAAGYKTALYTSPHLIRYNERIRVNGTCMADADLIRLIPLVEVAAAKASSELEGRPITFFEFTTALAFKYFQEQKPDVVILETGMGGRLDATNIITPLLSIITGISLDHTAYLGSNIAAIAREKAGIIKPAVPLITGPMPQEALDAIAIQANKMQAPWLQAAEAVSVRQISQNLQGQKIKLESQSFSHRPLALKLLGRHQMINVAIATASLDFLTEKCGLLVPEKALQRGYESVYWPGRFQVLGENPPFIVDGAHNSAGAEVLSEALKALFARRPLGIILGMCADKDLAAFLKALKVPIQQCWAVPIRSERSRSPLEIKQAVEAKGWPAATAPLAQALPAALAWAKKNKGTLCVCGSLFLAGEVLELRLGSHLFPGPRTD